MANEIHPARPAAGVCPRCGRIFERGFEVDGSKFRGHVKGDPKTCVPFGPVVIRDARERRTRGR